MATTTFSAVDALLYIRNGNATARWNFDDAVGTPVANPGGIGGSVQISYSFLRSPPSYTSVGGFQEFSQAQRAAARDALGAFEEIANIDFREVGGVGQMTFGNNFQPPGQGGFAYTPSWSYSFQGNTIVSVRESQLAGDVWINRNTTWSANAWQQGEQGYATLLHEIGHALGLKHPFDVVNNGFVLDPLFDHEGYTVMSYTSAPNTRLIEVTGNEQSFRWQESFLAPSSPMLMDIMALQFLYGANMDTLRGNDNYRWDTNEELLETIWDGGGVDTIDASNQVFACEIDLRQGAYSSIGLRQTDAELRLGLQLPSWFTQPLPVDTYNGRNNLAIALGATIENANGGASADRLTGNDAANRLTGNGGNDTLLGGNGDDVLNGGTGSDAMTGGAGNDQYHVDGGGDSVIEANNGGTDLVLSYLTNYTLGSHVEQGRIMAAGSAGLTGNALNNTLYAGNGNNLLAGGAGIDTVSYALGNGRAVNVSLATSAAQNTGGSGLDSLSSIENLAGSGAGDRLTGSIGNNVLAGGGGNDTLVGGNGDDTLVGGEGRDSLTGGSGRDIFDFDSLAEMGTRSSNWDVITDFVRGQDHIDLSTLDANAATAFNDAFRFIGSARFSGNATGLLRFEFDRASASVILYGSTDADSAAEFAIRVGGASSLTISDLIA